MFLVQIMKNGVEVSRRSFGDYLVAKRWAEDSTTNSWGGPNGATAKITPLGTRPGMNFHRGRRW